MKFYFVYVLLLSNGDYYVGFSDDLKRRLREHYQGQEHTTKMHLPCKLITYIAFTNKLKALIFEKYLKTGSGFAFRNRHFV